MPRFNQKSTTTTKVVNRAGGEAFKTTPEYQLVSLLLTSFLKDQYYRSANDSLKELSALVAQLNDKEFVAKAAIYARTEFGMRSITHALTGELFRLDKTTGKTAVSGQPWVKNFIEKVVHRPDDATEILAYYNSNVGKSSEPNQLKKGLALALAKFDEYQLAKYKGASHDVSLYDVANFAHPAHSDILEKLVNGTLKTPKTWEAKLSAAGKKGEEKDAAKKQAWGELLKTNKLGYFALLRNLRNIIEQAPEHLNLALDLLVDEQAIKKSLVLPFRFITAYDEIEKLSGKDARSVLVALSEAVDIACQNAPRWDGNTLVALDVSGSMQGRTADIAGLFAAILIKSNNADLLQFSDGASYKSVNPSDSVTTIAKQIRYSGGGTNFHSIFETANVAYDRIFILSDMQGWVNYHAPTSSFESYKKRYSCNPKVYSLDLAGYGDMQFPQQNVYAIAGFSDKIFDVMKLLEEDRQALINKIKAIEL